MTADISWLPAESDRLADIDSWLEAKGGELERMADELFELLTLGADWKVTLLWYNVDSAARNVRGARHWLWRHREPAP